ncbi:MAG: hypothetical protein IKO07_11735 [Clostridia bacterium]|nr:hypothetical protein [Clostridia bacterium]
MKKKTFEKPEAEVIRFGEDVIATSITTVTGGGQGAQGGTPGPGTDPVIPMP